MGLLTWPLKLPVLPLQGVVKLAETIGEQAERELRDPARVRRVLEDAQRRHDAGEITDEELSAFENAAVSDLVGEARPADRGSQDRS